VTNGTIYEDIPIAVGVTSYNTADHVVLFPAGSDVSVLVAQAANCGTDYYNPQPPDYLAGSIRYRVANGETVSCPPNLTLVNGSCVDTKSDAQNCGSAGKACAGTSLNIYATCSNGVCGTNGCVTGYADCDGNPANGCEVNTQNNPNNCGSCGYTCPATITNGTAGGCSNSQCVVSCNAGYTQCNNGPNVCTNLKTDALNCGSCYNNCANGIANGTSTGVCTNGSCGYTCNTGYSLCVNSGGYSSCANFQSDATNCGGCGIYCASGICSAGKCQ
jgi:hypothetical protein